MQRHALTQYVRWYRHRAQTHDPVYDKILPLSSSASVAQRERSMIKAGKSRLFYGKDAGSSSGDLFKAMLVLSRREHGFGGQYVRYAWLR